MKPDRPYVHISIFFIFIIGVFGLGYWAGKKDADRWYALRELENSQVAVQPLRPAVVWGDQLKIPAGWIGCEYKDETWIEAGNICHPNPSDRSMKVEVPEERK